MSRLPLNSRIIVFNTLLGHIRDEDNEEVENIYAHSFGIRIKTNTPAGEAVGVI